jgi:hypothetical protein
MDPGWVRDIRDRCIWLGVPFFFKQWGGVWKVRNGRVLDGRTWDEMPAAARLRARVTRRMTAAANSDRTAPPGPREQSPASHARPVELEW